MAWIDMWAGVWAANWGVDNPEEVVFSDFYNTQVEIYADTAFGTLVDIVNSRIDPNVLNELKGHGAGSFKVSKNDPKIRTNPNLLQYRNYVKIRFNGMVVGGFIIQTKKTTIVGAGEEADEMWEISGEGPRSWSRDASVYPAGGLKSNSAEDRYFNFATERGSWYNPSEWIFASTRWRWNNVVSGAPKGHAPANWPDASEARWIWNNPSTGGDPVGYCYFRHEFTVTGTPGTLVNYAFFVAADDSAEVFVDGEQKAVIEAAGWTDTTRVEMSLYPGNHVIGVKAYNMRGVGEILTALFKYGDPLVPSSAVLVNHSGMANTWRVNGYPAVEPGWSIGDVVLTLMNEAKDRGVRFANNFHPTFNAQVDSDGQPWGSPVSWSFSVGSTYESVFEAVEELGCDIYVDPDTLDMHVWKKRGSDRSAAALPQGDAVVFAKGKNLVSADETGQAEIANTLMLRTSEGWVEEAPDDTTSLTKYGRVETQMSTELTSTGVSPLIDELFNQKALPEVSATFEIVPLKGTIPFQDFNVGDYVSAPGEVPGVLEKRRVMSISFAEDQATGLPRYAMEFDTIFKDRQSELERWVSRLSNSSAIGGGMSNSGNLPPTVIVTPPGKPLSPIPDPPTGLAVTSIGRYQTDGASSSEFNLTWNPVITGQGFGTVEVNKYEVWGRRTGMTEPGLLAIVFDTFAVLRGFNPGDDWLFKVRAISDRGGPGNFSDEVLQTAAIPLPVLTKPNPPLATSSLGTVTLQWQGELLPPLVRYVRVERQNPGSSTWVAVGSLTNYSMVDVPNLTGQVVGYRFVTVDNYGRTSPPSDPTVLTVVGIDLGDLDQEIADAIEAAQNAADAAAALAGSAASAAEQAQIDADNAVTVSTSAQESATQAIIDAATALSTATTAQTSADGMITWSPNAPTTGDGAGKRPNAVWYRTSANGVIGQWRWNGTAWTSTPIDSDAIFSINAVKITAGTLDAARIAANSITSAKLLIGNFDNQIPDPTFSNVTVSGWTANGSLQLVTGGGRSATQNALRVTAQGTQRGYYNPINIPVRDGDIYRVSVWVKPSADIPAGSNLLAPYFQVDRMGSTQITWGINNTVPVTGGVWTKLEATFTVPVGAYQARSGLYIQAIVPAGTTVDFTEPEMIRVSDATLIADGSISTSKIVAGAITADKILAGIITGDKIAAGTISTSKLLVGNLDNQVENSSFEYGVAGWTLANGAVVGTANPRTGANALTVPTASTARVVATAVAAIAVEEGEQYRIAAWVRLLSGAVANTGIALRINWGPTEASTSNGSADIAITADNTTTSYVRQSGVWTAPAGAKFARLVVVVRDVVVGKTYYVDDISMYQMAAGELIVDGSITATKIGADEISAVHMQAGSIATAALQAGAITTEKLAADSVTANEIAAGAILAEHITAGSIQVSHLSPAVGQSLDISSNASVNILINRTDALEDGLDTTNTTVSQLTTYYSFGPDGAIIGQTDSAFKLYLKNDRIEILENGIVVSYWDSGRMVVPSFVGEEVVLGNHKLEKYTTGTVVRAI